MTKEKIISEKNIFNFQLLIIALYVAFQIFSDILSTKITYLPILKLAVDGGTIIYPLTFTLRDFVHKSCGKRNAQKLIFVSALINIIMVGLFFVVGIMPASSDWPHQLAYEAILMPIWRITLASIVAEVISELIDTEVFDAFYKKAKEFLGVFVSNGIALFIDSIIFSAIAFAGVLPFSIVVEIAISNIFIKAILTIISIPSIKFIPRLKVK